MRLTSREKQILAVLKKHPLISQDELAQRFHITRSSVAVHISNLIKKGNVLGKGYVCNEQATIVVIGESFMKIDINGQNDDTMIDFGFGGMAFELSEILANFGANVKVLTIIGNDELGTTMLKHLQDREIDISHVHRHSQKRSCRRVLVDDAVCFEESYDFKDYEKAINLREWVAFNCGWLVVEPQFLKMLVQNKEEQLPYFCTYKSLHYPDAIPDCLFNIPVVVLGVENHQELEFYYRQLARTPLKDVHHYVITDGNSGLIYFDKDNVPRDFPLLPNQRFNAKKRIPHFLAGLVYGLSCGYPLRQAIRISIGTASSGFQIKTVS